MNQSEEFILEKLDNFKVFVREISKNRDVVDEYQNLSFFKLRVLAYTYLIPNRYHLRGCATRMQDKLDFEDKHLPKFLRYLSLFVEYQSGTPVPEDIKTQEPKSYDELLQDLMDDE